MTRTWPNVGQSPIDAYMDPADRSLGYFEAVNVATTSGARRAVEVMCTYTPAGGSGYTTTMGLSAKVVLDDDMSFTGGVGYMWGVQAQLQFDDGATVNNASSIFAAGRFVMTATGTPVFTEAEGICNIYCDNLITTDMDGLSTGFSSFIFANNSGGAMDTAIYLRCRNDVATLFRFEDCGTMVVAQSAKSGTNATVAVDWEGTTYYINMYQ